MICFYTYLTKVVISKISKTDVFQKLFVPTMF